MNTKEFDELVEWYLYSFPYLREDQAKLLAERQLEKKGSVIKNNKDGTGEVR